MESRLLQKIDKTIDTFNLISTGDPRYLIQAYIQCEEILQEANKENLPHFVFMAKLIMLDCKINLGLSDLSILPNEFKSLMANQSSVPAENKLSDYIKLEITRLREHIESFIDLHKSVNHHYKHAVYLMNVLSVLEEANDDYFDYDDHVDDSYITTVKNLFSLNTLEDQVKTLENTVADLKLAASTFKNGLRSNTDVLALRAELQESLADGYFDLYEVSHDQAKKKELLLSALSAYQKTNKIILQGNKTPSINQHFSILNVYEQLARNGENANHYIQQIKSYINKKHLINKIELLDDDEREEAEERLQSHLDFCQEKKRKAIVNTEIEPELKHTKNSLPLHDDKIELTEPRASLLAEFNEYSNALQQHYKLFQLQPQNNNNNNDNEKAQRIFLEGMNHFKRFSKNSLISNASNLFLAMARAHHKNELHLNTTNNNAIIKGLLKTAIVINKNNRHAKNALLQLGFRTKNIDKLKPCAPVLIPNYFDNQLKKYLAQVEKVYPNLMPNILYELTQEFNSNNFMQLFGDKENLKSTLIDMNRLLTPGNSNQSKLRMA